MFNTLEFFKRNCLNKEIYINGVDSVTGYLGVGINFVVKNIELETAGKINHSVVVFTDSNGTKISLYIKEDLRILGWDAENEEDKDNQLLLSYRGDSLCAEIRLVEGEWEF